MHSADEVGCGISSRPKMCLVLDFPATLLTDLGKASLMHLETVLGAVGILGNRAVSSACITSNFTLLAAGPSLGAG